MSEGDWICCDPHCANINFARRNKCNRCHKDRTDGVGKKKLGQEIGKALADKSRGLFSADDWQCNKCGNVNWARRQQCNMCNAPKFGEIEERTGYGGGYNDRGVVEYIKRDDSDSEYDEFGRRKKKRHAKSSSDENDDQSPTPAKRHTDKTLAKPAEVNEKSDEEDDGDDDLDLSKYDLSGWGDDDHDDNEDEDDDEDEDEKTHSSKQINRDYSNREHHKINKRRNSTLLARSRSRSRSRSPSSKK